MHGLMPRVVAFVGGTGLLYLAYREATRPWGSDPVTVVLAIAGATVLLSFALRRARRGLD